MRKHDHIWNNETLLREKASEADSIKNLLELLGIPFGGGSQSKLTRLLDELGIQKPDSKLTRARKTSKKNTFPDEKVFTENSTYTNRNGLRQRILSRKVLEYRCSKCGLGPTWEGIVLTLQLDHTNGISNDNRLENLRFLCPNCHSQTDTYAGRNRPNTKVSYPPDDELLELAKEFSISEIARTLNCSASSVSHKIRRIKNRHTTSWIAEDIIDYTDHQNYIRS